MRIEYSYTLLDKRGHEIDKGNISKEKYDEVITNTNIKLIHEWETEYKYETLYGKRYSNKEGYTLFLWREEWK